MIEVHPPEHRIGGFRDFLIHLLTITVGLLIALSLEGVVEWSHHRHLRHEAETNLRQELEENRKDIHEANLAAGKELQNLKQVVQFVDDKLAGKDSSVKGLQLGMLVTTLRAGSWQTANATGALAYMDYNEVQRYAQAYELQKQYSDLQSATLNDFVALQSYIMAGQDPSKLAPADLASGKRQLQLAMAKITASQNFGAALEHAYDNALKAE